MSTEPYASDETAPPSEEDVKSYLNERRNWGRWGEDDQRGTLNLLTPQRRMAAFSAVRTGETLSLSRPLVPGYHQSTQHWMKYWHNGGENSHVRANDTNPGGWASDYFGLPFHGHATTHLDALCHVWDEDGMYNGRNPDEHLTPDGATFGGVEHMATGIIARGVLLDIPAFRGTPYVTVDAPVHGSELEAAAKHQGVEIEPGDALCVYSGRERWQADSESRYGDRSRPRPGLHASCLPFVRDHDVSVLAWDMLDANPWEYDVPFTMHGAIWAYGLPLIDNVVLEDLARACQERGAYEFMLVTAPLVMQGGTGSPVNPLAVI